MPKEGKPARDRLVSAATKLFYGEGIRSVSIEAVAKKAGVTKRTFYYHFRSKDDLVAAYLEARDQPTLDLFARWFNESKCPINKKIEGMFQKFARATKNPNWKGCGFLRTSAELASTPGHPAFQAGAAHKKKFEAWLADTLASEGIKDAKTVARKIVVLLDGAASVMLVHRDPDYIQLAGAVAASLVADNM